MLLCRVIGVSKSGYYEYLKRPKRQVSPDELVLLRKIKRIYNQYNGTYGAKRIAQVLKAQNVIVNHKKVTRLMKEANLKAKVRIPKSTSENKLQATGYVYPNHIQRDFHAIHPNTKWVTDITEIMVDNVKLYISAIMDLFNREIIAFKISNSPNQELVDATIKAAQKKRKLATLKDVIIHSDQGSVYRSLRYNQLSHSLKFIPSMSRKANCWDNAVIESFFSHLKTEFPCFYTITDVDSIQRDLIKYIHYYNEKRIQKKIGFVSPKEYYLNYLRAA